VAPTPLNPTLRYIPPGVRKVYWAATIATQASPTAAEINAGIDLTNEIAEINGFQMSSDTADVPDLASRFTAQVPGRITAADSSITFYADSTSNDVRTVLPRDTAGFVLMLPEGNTAGRKMDVWPVKVKTCAPDLGMEDPQKILVEFAVTKIASNNVTVPAGL
jgi:hypothetical protein